MSLLRTTVATLSFLSLGLAACAGQDTPVPDVSTETRPEVGASATPLAHDGAPSKSGSGSVKLEIEVPPGMFLKGQAVTVTVWSEKERAKLERSAGCAVSMDASGKESTMCPPGVTFEKAHPETFTIAYEKLGSKVVLDLKSIAVGERYDIAVGGAAADGCNHTGGGARGVAGPTIELHDLDFTSTLLACLPSAVAS